MKPEKKYSYVEISPSLIAAAIAGFITVLVLVHSVLTVCWLSPTTCGSAMGPINFFGHLFDLNREWNIPTWFSVIQLFATSLALILVAVTQKSRSAGLTP